MRLKLETERLILKTPTEKHAEKIALAIDDPRIAVMTLNIPNPYSFKDAMAWLESLKKPEKRKHSANFTVFLKGTDDVIGGIGLADIDQNHRRAEIGWWCAVDHWNKGYTTEAACKVVDYAFEKLGLERVMAICLTINPASARVMDKIGMKFEGIARHEFIKDGKFMDFRHYAIIRSDWDAMKGK
jgi:[ribosomal protein S5]-alanine N-acetyltransferase